MLKAQAVLHRLCVCVCVLRLVLRGLQMAGLLKKRSKGTGKIL